MLTKGFFAFKTVVGLINQQGLTVIIHLYHCEYTQRSIWKSFWREPEETQDCQEIVQGKTGG